MFKLKIDKEVHLELTHFYHAKDTFILVERNRELFRTWLDWVDTSTTIEDTKEFINHEMQNYANNKSINCMIFYNNKLVGNVALLGMQKGYGIKRGKLGYWLDVEFHGKGIMQKSVKKMIEIGFEYYDLDKITLRCSVENRRSCNVAKKLGFTHEGRLKNEIALHGIKMDVDIYAVLRDEYLQE
ncbi:Ribosomal-protein-L7p-serine acetyltransferase [hydrothermal vent metagenome]|uniref:Ribosomal-protein-L7p-serine acetyltransferase n=1 Tax=hydrothermal vent metagenome TaxID=652676 RepID=A0A1W1BGL9_9ZZZZ